MASPCGNVVDIPGQAVQLTRRVFWSFVGCHVALWTALPALTQPNRPLDMVEMAYWGHHLQWGYYKHPPLPAWLAEAATQISGGASWSLYLVAASAVAVSFWAAWSLAKEFLPPWPALCASTLLEACAYYNYTTADLNHTIVLQPLWALSALFLYRALTTQKAIYWAATGAALGVGMLAKYDIALLTVSMLLLPAVNPRARAALSTPGPYITLAVSLLVFSPHLAWMIGHDFSTVTYAVDRADTTRAWPRVYNPIEFFLSQLLALLPMLIVAAPLWRRRGKPATRRVPLDSLQRDFLLVVCFGPLTLDLVLSIASGVQLQSMWGAPMWTMFGVCLVLWCGIAAEARVYRSVIIRTALVGLLVLAAVGVKNVAGPYMRHKPSRVHFPGHQLAELVRHEWEHQTGEPLEVVAGPWWVAANVGLELSGHVQIYDFVYPNDSPWSSNRQLEEHGGVIVWEHNDDGAKCATLARFQFPGATVLPNVEVPCQTGANVPPARFGIAIVLPKSQRRAAEDAYDEPYATLLHDDAIVAGSTSGAGALR